GRLAAFRIGWLRSRGLYSADLQLDEDQTRQQALAGINPRSVGHIRRVLYHRHGIARLTAVRPAATPASVPDASWPHVSIIVPTRDRHDLLSTCVRGLR